MRLVAPRFLHRLPAPAEEWAKGLTCQTAKTPACHIQFVTVRFYLSLVCFLNILKALEIKTSLNKTSPFELI